MTEYFQAHDSLQYQADRPDALDGIDAQAAAIPDARIEETLRETLRRHRLPEPDSLLEQAYEDAQTGGCDGPDDDYTDEEAEREAWRAELAGEGERFNAQPGREE